MGNKDEQQSVLSALMPILLAAVAVPLSMFLWIGNMALSFFTGSHEMHREGGSVIPPTRWLMSMVIPLAFVAWGLKKRSLNTSGAVLGLIVGFVLTLSSYSFLACLMTFFVTSSKATKYRSDKKRKIEKEFKEGGQRNWIQVLCNGGMATELALLYLIDSGCGERTVDFSRDYRASWLSMGVLGAFACCNGDTWASELGSVIGNTNPFLITTREKVPRGTNGGVTVGGLLFSFFGGLMVGVAYYISVVQLVDSSSLLSSPPQWPLIIAGGLAGLVGSVVDSLLGATLQYSGVEEKTGCIVERPGRGVKHISGVPILDNHSVNLISSIIMGLLTPWLANILWV
ncbi:transmembrane protein 19 [Cloeon dipterum]|uniref:transmembrane protein 19 n=1 Tax=Cloeon dipterum TaxID=197152 RepID=UPI00321F85A7